MPSRPPKEFMDAALPAIASQGTAEAPGAVAASTWKKMSPKARAPWERLRTLREMGAQIVPGNPGPLALTPAGLALKGAETVAQVATGDIFVIRSIIPRGTKKNPLPPILVETHVNLAAIGLGLLAAALAALIGSAAWNGVFGVPGLKEGRVRSQESAGNILFDLFGGVTGPLLRLLGR